MSKDPEENYDDIFEEIVESNDLKDVYKDIDNEKKLEIKEIILLQQEISSALVNLCDIMYLNVNLDNDLNVFEDENISNLIRYLYKNSLDFNEAMSDYFLEDLDLDLDESDDEDE